MRSLLLLLALAAAAPAQAQLGVGGQLGTPTGLALKFGDGRGAVLVAVGWDLDDAVEVEGHYLLRDRRLSGSSSNVRVFYGPGAFIRTANDNTAAGLSLGVGLSAPLVPELEVYGPPLAPPPAHRRDRLRPRRRPRPPLPPLAVPADAPTLCAPSAC